MICYAARDASGATVGLYLPQGQWDYLGWLTAQGFDLDRFTQACDARRGALNAGSVTRPQIPFGAFVMVTTDRLHQLQYRPHVDRANLVQPVFPNQATAAIEKAARYFESSGPDALAWCGWRA
ncbi:MAG: hypothetical protein AAFX62_17005 [Pseudomonadota bacterium]